MYSVDDSSEISVEDLGLQGIMFQEPSDYFKPEQPAKSIEHNLLSGQTLHLRLVGHNPLWVYDHTFLGLKSMNSRLIQRLRRDITSGMAPKCFPLIYNITLLSSEEDLC